jgi:hypothetical protein
MYPLLSILRHDAHSESSSSIPAPGKRTPYKFLNSLKVKGAKLQEKLKRIRSVPSKANNHPVEKTRTKNKKKPNGDVLLNMQLVNQVDTNDNEKGIEELIGCSLSRCRYGRGTLAVSIITTTTVNIT